MNRVFIGFDPNEVVAYYVLSHSIRRNSSKPIAICPIDRRLIPEFTRPKEGATEFSFSRFLTPYLAGYQGKAVFMDCDMLVLGDISELFELGDDHMVYATQHSYTPKTTTKFLGNPQPVYPCKNWSSVMMFNCDQCQYLQPHIVDTRSGAYLHQFEWADTVGAIPLEWNWLVGEYDYKEDVKNIHYTLGTPCFDEYKDCDYSDLWFKELEMMNYATNE